MSSLQTETVGIQKDRREIRGSTLSLVDLAILYGSKLTRDWKLSRGEEEFGGRQGSSDVVPGPLDGTAQHHAKDHPKDLGRRRRDGVHQSNKNSPTSSAHKEVNFRSLTMMMPMPIPTPPMMCSLLLNTSSMAAGQLWESGNTTGEISGQVTSAGCDCRPVSVTVVTRTSSPSFLGQISLPPSNTVPVGPQQFSYGEEEKLKAEQSKFH